MLLECLSVVRRVILTHEDEAFKPVRFTVLDYIVDGEYCSDTMVSPATIMTVNSEILPAKNIAIDSYGSKRRVRGFPRIHASVTIKLENYVGSALCPKRR